ncbi:MAG: hypothetical protein OEY45_02940 [Gammaproteobacteria bacterium]|nr:hypothetical protein [Gammaproteobacteria bacterium]
MLTRRISGILLALYSGVAYSGDSGDIYLSDRVIQLVSIPPARAIIYDTPINGESCTHNNVPVLLFDEEQGYLLGKEMYSTLIDAKLAGKKVQIVTKGCWGKKDNSFPVIVSIALKN